MYKIILTTKFKKDLKKVKKVSIDFKLTSDFLKILKNKGVNDVDIQMKPPNKKQQKNQNKFLSELPEKQRKEHARLFRFGNATYIYHHQKRWHIITSISRFT